MGAGALKSRRPIWSLLAVTLLMGGFKVFDKAGHGFHRWQYHMRYLRLTEDSLARCLGGRSGGFDFFEVGAWLL